MSRLWFAIACLTGLLVGTVVSVWPVGPLWMAGTEHGAALQGFNGDGTRFITSHVPEGAAPYVCHWDVATGQMAARVGLPNLQRLTFDEQRFGAREYYRFQLMDDGRTLIVGTYAMEVRSTRARDGTPFQPVGWYRWCLVDAQTGATVQEPEEGEPGVLTTTSRDGRWYCRRVDQGLSLYQRGGERVKHWAEADGWAPEELRIAPVGQSAVILWVDASLIHDAIPRGQRTRKRCSITIVELPSCRVRAEFELKYRQSDACLHHWDGRWLWLADGAPEDTHYHRIEKYDTTQLRTEHVGALGMGGAEVVVVPEPDDRHFAGFHDQGMDTYFGYHRGGDGWIAYLGNHTRPESAWDTVLDRLAIRRSTAPERPDREAATPLKTGTSVRIRNLPSGRLRASLPPLVRPPVKVSPDGKYLASSTGPGVALWDLDPTPRWVKALTAGVGTGGVLMLFAWWRRRRKVTFALRRASP